MGKEDLITKTEFACWIYTVKRITTKRKRACFWKSINRWMPQRKSAWRLLSEEYWQAVQRQFRNSDALLGRQPGHNIFKHRHKVAGLKLLQ